MIKRILITFYEGETREVLGTSFAVGLDGRLEIFNFSKIIYAVSAGNWTTVEYLEDDE